MKVALPLTLSGEVTPFKGNGRKLGYPTANLIIDTEANDGVYFGFATLASWVQHPAIIFIGTPTTMGDTERRVEAHLLDIPDQDYYGEMLTLALHQYHRANQTFASIDQLLGVMRSDETAARQWFGSGSTLQSDGAEQS